MFSSAEFFSWGTRLLKKIPPLDWLLVGPNNVPDGWQHISAAASDIDSMVRFDGDPRLINRLPVPRLYRFAGIMSIRKTALERLQQEHETGRFAVGIGIGEAVVVGALGEGQSFTPDDKDKGRLLVAARIGYGDLWATPGLYVAEEQGFFVPEAEDVSAVARVPKTSLSVEVIMSV